MARQLILAIAESAESLEQQLKTSRTASQKEKCQARTQCRSAF